MSGATPASGAQREADTPPPTRLAYLDNNATSPLLPEILERMLPYLKEQFGNASSLHACGRRALAALTLGRDKVAALLGCRAAEIVFTSGGTEANNLALLGLLSPGDHLIVSAIEHSSIAQAVRHLEQIGCEVSRVGVNRHGQVEADAICQALRPRTRLISVMMANNETGVLQPVEEIGRIARKAKVWFHTDAVQAAGKVPLSVDAINCDLLSLSAHKIHGPQGSGALFVRRGTPLRPRTYGGRQEKGRRVGTENVPAIAGFGQACEIARRGLADGSVERLAIWRDLLEGEILRAVPHAGVSGGAVARVPNTTNLFFDGVGADALILALDAAGIAVSRGAACTSGESEPSSVLMAMGLSGERSRSSLRLSLGKMNTKADIERVISLLPKAVRRLREGSLFFSAA